MSRQTVTLEYSMPIRVVVDMETEQVERVEALTQDIGHPRAVSIPGSAGERDAIAIAERADWPAWENDQ